MDFLHEAPSIPQGEIAQAQAWLNREDFLLNTGSER